MNNQDDSSGSGMAGIGSWSKSSLLTVGVMVTGGLLLRAVFLGCQKVLNGDEIHYAEALFHFMHGNFMEGFSEYWSFFYPFLGIPFGFLAGGAEEGLRLLSIIAGTILIVPVALIADTLWDRRTALFAAVLTAMHPFLIVSSTTAGTSSLYTLLLMVFIYLLVRLVLGGGGWWILAVTGLMVGLAYLVRSEAQFFLLLAVVIILVGRGGKGVRVNSKRRIEGAALMLFVFALTVLPQMLLVHHKTGRLSAGSKASVNLSSPLIWSQGLDREEYVYSLTAGGTQRQVEKIGQENPVAVLWHQRKEIASRYGGRFTRGIRKMPELLASPLLLLLLPLGIFGRRWIRERRGAEFILILSGLLPLLLYSMFQVQIRYLIPFLPIYLLWSAAGCEQIVLWVKENVSPRPVAGSLVLFVIFISLVPFTVRKYSSIRHSNPTHYREVGNWIRENLGDDVSILAHSGCPVSYYAGNPRATFIPWTDREGLLAYARRKNFDYLIVDEDYFEGFRPQMKELSQSASFNDLSRIETFIKPSGSRIIIYALR